MNRGKAGVSQVEMDLQPIETAPKDCTAVLLHHKLLGWNQGWYDACLNRWRLAAIPFVKLDDEQLDYWMNLPAYKP